MYFKSLSYALHIMAFSSFILYAAPESKNNPNQNPPTQETQIIQQKQKELYFLKGQYYYDVQSKENQVKKNKQRNGVFLGGSLGIMSMRINQSSSIAQDNRIPQDINPISFGLMGGYSHYIGSAPIGIRIYGQYLGAWRWNMSSNTDNVSTHLLSFNIDMVGDMPIGYEEGYSLGAYAGLGAGVAFFTQNNTSYTHVGSVFNLGLSMILSFHHRIEAGVKIPPTALNVNHAFSLVYLASYQYLF